jgi:aminoglycoside phosphotransferase (APT) family kinase protein
MQWAPEVCVTPQLAAELVREQFPGLDTRQVTVLETGWDNTACQVDGQWLFRFPRREIAIAGVLREIAVLPRLAARLPLPIPVPEFVGQPSPRYPWPFWGARLLPGRELAESGLADADRSGAATAVGHFLRALHEPSLVAIVGRDDLPVDPMRRASAPYRAGRARESLDRLVSRGIWAADRDVEFLLDRAEGEAVEPASTAAVAAVPGVPGVPGGSGAAVPGGSGAAGSGPRPLVVSHGDLHVRHLLVGADGAATGVIDWGDLCLADPAVDLSIAYCGFAGQARADLLSAYGAAVDAQRELAARVLAISLAASLAEYAADEGRPVLLQESIAGLRRAVAA